MSNRWNKKRVAGMMVSIVAYAGCVFWLSGQEPYIALRGMLCLSVVAMFLALYAAWKPFKLFILILCSCLFISQADARPDQQEDQEPLAGACVLGMIILGVGVVIIISLKKMCNRCLPPPHDPPQPPCPTTNHTYSASASLAPGTISLPLSDDAVQCYDVSSYSFEHNDPNGYPYLLWFTCVIESSTNLSNWRSKCTINGWASASTICLLLSDENGEPVCTNFVSRTSSSISGQLPGLVADADRQFFRVK